MVVLLAGILAGAGCNVEKETPRDPSAEGAASPAGAGTGGSTEARSAG